MVIVPMHETYDVAWESDEAVMYIPCQSLFINVYDILIYALINILSGRKVN